MAPPTILGGYLSLFTLLYNLHIRCIRRSNDDTQVRRTGYYGLITTAIPSFSISSRSARHTHCSFDPSALDAR